MTLHAKDSLHHHDPGHEGQLNLELISGLTLHGDTVGAQVREYTVEVGSDQTESVLAIDVSRAGLSPEHGAVHMLSADDTRALRDLLNVATARGFL